MTTTVESTNYQSRDGFALLAVGLNPTSKVVSIQMTYKQHPERCMLEGSKAEIPLEAAPIQLLAGSKAIVHFIKTKRKNTLFPHRDIHNQNSFSQRFLGSSQPPLYWIL